MTRIENTAKTQITLGKNPDARKKIGLVLGSGFARRLARLGVIRALEEAGIEVDPIAGTSMGVLVGTIHAARKLDTLEATFRDFGWKKTASFFDAVSPKSGLLDGAKVGQLVRSHIRADTIEMLSKAFAVVAADIVIGEEVAIRNGDVIEAVRASISVPGIFTPVRGAHPGGRRPHQSGAGERGARHGRRHRDRGRSQSPDRCRQEPEIASTSGKNNRR